MSVTTLYVSGSTLMNSGAQSISYSASPLTSLLGSGIGALTSIANGPIAALSGLVGAIDLINGEGSLGLLGGGIPGALLGGSAGAFIDSVSTVGTGLGSLGAPVLGSLGALGATAVTAGLGAAAGLAGVLSAIAGALGLGTAIPAGLLTSAPNSLIGLSQLFGG